jgi:PPIC-type PPIASE domain
MTSSVYSLRLWDESSSLDDHFAKLAGTPFQHTLAQEIARAFILRRALQEHPVAITLDETMKSTLLTKFGQQRGLKDTVSLQRWLRENKTSPEKLVERLAHLEQLEHLKAAIIPTEMVRERFVLRKSRLDQIVFAVIRMNKEAAAWEAYYCIRHDGQDFSEVATRFSIGSEAKQGGVRGPLSVSELNPLLKRQLLRLKPNETSEPFLLQDLYFIVKLIRLEPAQLTEETTRTLRNELFEEWMERQLTLAGARLNETPEPVSPETSPATRPTLRGVSAH